MNMSHSKAIMRLYNEVVNNGVVMDEDQSIEEITAACEKQGQFIFRGDSFWSFVKTTDNDKDCIRMIFALKESVGGKVFNIGRLMDLLKSVDDTLIFVDIIKLSTRSGFRYIDIIKYIN